MFLYNNINKDFIKKVENYNDGWINYESIFMPDSIEIEDIQSDETYHKGINSYIALVDSFLKGYKIPYKGLQRISFKHNNKYFGLNYSIINVESKIRSNYRGLLTFAEMDYLSDTQLSRLVKIDSIYTVKKGLGIAKLLVDVIKEIAWDSPIIAEAGYIYKEDYEENNDAIDKAISFWESQGFKDVNGFYGRYEEKRTMLYR